jgi:hypothetical protein
MRKLELVEDGNIEQHNRASGSNTHFIRVLKFAWDILVSV